ncbi:MAG: hypothetical protein IMW96_00415 [Thermoanaerobacteraceae bacterium]|nr:hypothetical protein [Thermoanaerobacteraceae bacterium]
MTVNLGILQGKPIIRGMRIRWKTY